MELKLRLDEALTGSIPVDSIAKFKLTLSFQRHTHERYLRNLESLRSHQCQHRVSEYSMPMSNVLLTVLVGLLGGIAVGLQSPIAGAMGARVGGAASSLIVHLGGALISLVLLIAARGENLREWRSLPFYMLGAGVFGVILYLTLSYTLPRLGASTALILIIAAQLLMGLVVDHFGWFGLPVKRVQVSSLIGMALVVAGGVILIRR
jgi:bacterial/archaeal transporter family-2 protein